ncbi:MAG: hypothetical protein Q9201_000412 [Fulgogasparrea decipioides]
MSGYGKSSDHSVNESTISPRNEEADNSFVYGERPSLGDTSYIGYGNYGYGASLAQPLPDSYEQTQQRLAFSTDTYYAPNSSYHTSQLSYTGGRSQKVPMVISWGPDRGSQGTPVDIHLQSTHDLDPLTDYGVCVMFAKTQCPAILSRVESQASTHNYVIGTNAPAFSSTGWRSQHVPVSLRIQDQPGLETDNINVGYFRYTDLDRSALSPQGLSQKGELSTASSQVLGPVAKGIFSQQLQSPAPQVARVYIPGLYHANNPGKPQASQSRIQTPSTSPYSTHNTGQSPFKKSPLIVCGAPDRSSRGPGPEALEWSSTYTAMNSTSSSIGASSTNSLSGSPSSFIEPVLVRTTNLPPSSSRSLVSGSRSARDPFGLHTSHPHKASIVVNGDLDSMAKNWTAEECRVKRRLVQFSRFQRGSTVYTSFEPTTVEDRVPNGICVSCIWWREENGYFITSVDTLDLLEKLIRGHAGKFGECAKERVEEKNCIRRNLEGYGPITVKKTPPEEGSDQPNTVRFFNQIMSFGDPKPRHIAKDVKVFKWQDLKHALQKVTSKYSANYSSISTTTIHSNRPACSGVYGPTSQPDYHLPPNSNVSDQNPNSPRSTSNSTQSSAYSTASCASSTTSPNMSHGLPTASQAEASLSSRPLAAVTRANTDYAIESLGLQYSSYAATAAGGYGSISSLPASMTVGQQQPTRTSWDFSYVETASAAIAGASEKKASFSQS